MQMETPLAISDDALKILVAEHGVRGTARLLGMDERQTDAFRQRVTRGKWLSEPAIAALRAKASPTSPFTPVVAKMSPTVAIAQEIQALGQQSRIGLAKASASVATFVATRKPEQNLEDAGNIKAAAQTADLVFGWKDAAPQVKIRLDVLGSVQETPVFDVEADVSADSSWDNEADPLEDY